MSFSKMLEILQERNEKKIVLIRLGMFYIATGRDAVLLHDKLNLKCTCFTDNVCKVGIPVIAIGIPTVVDLATVTNECIDIFIENLQEKAMSNDYLNKLKERDNYEDIKEALVPKDYNMIVTPKEIDKLIENMSKIISKAINMAM